MNRALVLTTTFAIVAACPLAYAGPKEDVAAVMQAWVDAMNSHDTDKVVALYDKDAVLWGTRAATIRDDPASVRDYFNILSKVPPSYKVVVNDQHIRVYGDVAIDTGAYTFSELHDDKPLLRPARFSMVFHRHDGRWMIVDHHSSATPAP